MPTPLLLTKADYEAIARFRYALRKFLRFSEEQARKAGLTAQQYQAMVAIRGFPGQDYVTVGELAERLQIKHHSAVELTDRLVVAGLARRQHSDHDRRLVCIYLTREGERLLDELVSRHAPDLRELARDVLAELSTLVEP